MAARDSGLHLSSKEKGRPRFATPSIAPVFLHFHYSCTTSCHPRTTATTPPLPTTATPPSPALLSLHNRLHHLLNQYTDQATTPLIHITTSVFIIPLQHRYHHSSLSPTNHTIPHHHDVHAYTIFSVKPHPSDHISPRHSPSQPPSPKEAQQHIIRAAHTTLPPLQ